MDNEDLVEEARNGNTEAYLALYQNNKGLITHCCYRAALEEDEFEDFMQEAYICLVRAVKGYKKDKGFKFTSYFITALKSHLKRYAKYNRCKEAVTLNQPLQKDNSEAAESIDIIPDPKICTPEERFNHTYLKIQLDRALKKLPARRVKLVKLFYGYERPRSELCKLFNMEPRKVTIEIQMARNKLRRDKELRSFWEEWRQGYHIRRSFYKGTGLSAFKDNQSSSVEEKVMEIFSSGQKLWGELSSVFEI